MKPRRPIRIGVMMYASEEYGRRVLSGVVDYVYAHERGSVHWINAEPRGADRTAIAGMDGLVLVLGHNQRNRVMNVPGPKVFVPHLSAPAELIMTTTDSCVVGRLGAEHLLSLGLRHLTVISYVEHEAGKELAAAFRQAVETAGATFVPGVSAVQNGADGQAWTAGLPTPCGILAETDRAARIAIDWARAAGRNVPQEIAVLGVGNDMIECMTQTPTLSSIAMPAERVGWCAAELLHRHIAGEQVESIEISPSGLIPRESTQTLAVTDPAVAEAIRNMRLNLKQPPRVADLAARVTLTSRALESRFRRHLGRSIHAEMTRLRLDHALTLLRMTDTPINEIGPTVGIADHANFTRFIRKHTGQAPLAFRKKTARQSN